MHRPTDTRAVGSVRIAVMEGRDDCAPEILCRSRAAYRLPVNALPPAPCPGGRVSADHPVPIRWRLRQATAAAPAPESTMKPIAARNAGDVGEEAVLPAMT